jgi:hypothetical protein
MKVLQNPTDNIGYMPIKRQIALVGCNLNGEEK